jgi:hypothetical protein
MKQMHPSAGPSVVETSAGCPYWRVRTTGGAGDARFPPIVLKKLAVEPAGQLAQSVVIEVNAVSSPLSEL